jgi:hypothetical protein
MRPSKEEALILKSCGEGREDLHHTAACACQGRPHFGGRECIIFVDSSKLLRRNIKAVRILLGAREFFLELPPNSYQVGSEPF